MGSRGAARAPVMRFPEELLLLLFDDERGDLTGTLPPGRLDILLAGAVLMDLALEERIDTDPRRLTLVDPTPVDDELLDPALADIAQAPDLYDIDHWVRRQAERGEEVRERALARLADLGILVSDDAATDFLLSRRVSRARRYHPAPDGTVQEEVRLRVMRVLFSDDIPDPRDTVIICLADAGGVLDYLLSREERAEVQHRIDLVKKLDLIGQAVTRAVREAESAGPATRAARPPQEIPCAAGLPLAGNALDLARDAEAFLLMQYRSLGPVFRVRAFGRRFVVLAGPEANLLLARGKRPLPHLRGLAALRCGCGRDAPDHEHERRRPREVAQAPGARLLDRPAEAQHGRGHRPGSKRGRKLA